MRRFLWICLGIFLSLIPSLASAQTLQKFDFNIGGGLNVATGDAGSHLTPGWNFNAGGGYKLTKHLAANLDFNVNRWKLNAPALRNFDVPAGHTTVWSLTVQPVYSFRPDKSVDFYTTAGFGLYHRNLVFTQPVLANTVNCDPFFGFCFNQTVTINQVLAEFGTYKPGFNFGGGFSFRLGASPFKFYTEARYNEMFASGSNLTFVPITAGIRW